MYKIAIISYFFISSVLFCQQNGNDNFSFSPSGPISVTIGGAFIVNGSFPASQFERVDQFITRIYTHLEKEQAMNSFARRNIILKRIDGRDLIIDLEKFRLTGDFKNNPYLKNDDVLIFPQIDVLREFISIDGAVNNPVKFQFVSGDKLSDALLFAQGLSEVYENVTQAEITRLNYSGSREDVIKVDIKSDFYLYIGDRIRVLADENCRKDYRVFVAGEVNKPGYIAISRNNTTMKEVIERAGGFKSNASLNNTELIRRTENYSSNAITKAIQTKSEELLMSRMSYLTEEDTGYFRLDNELRLSRSNVLVDFARLDSDTSEASKFIMRDGDVILVPEKKDLVYVYGQVANAGYVRYSEGKDINYYIEQVGGLGELAKDIDEINIIKAKSRAWVSLSNENVIIEPGDYIWVPKKTPRTFSYYLQKVGTISGIIGTIATVALLLVQVNK
ncbi:MAG: SLBB domain-containing protein [Ignavibacteria bacterium]